MKSRLGPRPMLDQGLRKQRSMHVTTTPASTGVTRPNGEQKWLYGAKDGAESRHEEN
jgi:hypothetical protein